MVMDAFWPSAFRAEAERLFALWNLYNGQPGLANRFGTECEPIQAEWLIFTDGCIVIYPPFSKGGDRKNSDLEC